MNQIGTYAEPRLGCSDVRALSRVDGRVGRFAGLGRITSRLAGYHLVEDVFGWAVCLLLWAALWSLFIVAYSS